MSVEVRELWESLGRDECAYPTAEQLLAFLRTCSDEVGTGLAQRLIDGSETAHRCWLYGHEQQLSFWKTYAHEMAAIATSARESDGQGERAHGDGTAAQGSAQGDVGGKR